MKKVSILVRLFEGIYHHLTKGTKYFPEFLTYKGIKLGKRIWWGDMKTISIDYSRPSLVEIGDDVRINTGFTLMTHDASNMVLRRLFNDFVPSSGKVKIGNNVYFGRWCTVLKGVEIGDNCIIGYGSVVTRSIPANSVAIGRPAKVLCSIEDYYNKRKERCIEEALDYARSIQERFGRKPEVNEFFEEFPLFLKGDELNDQLPIREQLRDSYVYYKKNNVPVFDGFDDFLKHAGVL